MNGIVVTTDHTPNATLHLLCTMRVVIRPGQWEEKKSSLCLSCSSSENCWEPKSMIASRLPPSRVFGGVATAIHTSSFRCFVSTARKFLASRRWETVIFSGDPALRDALAPCAWRFYPTGFKRDDIYRIHDASSEWLNDLGGSRSSLTEAASAVIRISLENRGIDRAFENYVRRGAGVYACEIVERGQQNE